MFKRSIAVVLSIGLVTGAGATLAQVFAAPGSVGQGRGPEAGEWPVYPQQRDAHRRAMQNMTPEQASAFREQMWEQRRSQWESREPGAYADRPNRGPGYGSNTGLGYGPRHQYRYEHRHDRRYGPGYGPGPGRGGNNWEGAPLGRGTMGRGARR